MQPRYTLHLTPLQVAVAELVPIGLGLYLITRLEVPAGLRCQGHGRRLLQLLVNDADREGATLCLLPSSSGWMTNRQLIDWYRRHGFRPDDRPIVGLLARSPQSNSEKYSKGLDTI